MVQQAFQKASNTQCYRQIKYIYNICLPLTIVAPRAAGKKREVCRHVSVVSIAASPTEQRGRDEETETSVYPSGHLVENRFRMAGVVPTEYSGCTLHRVRGWFRAAHGAAWDQPLTRFFGQQKRNSLCCRRFIRPGPCSCRPTKTKPAALAKWGSTTGVNPKIRPLIWQSFKIFHLYLSKIWVPWHTIFGNPEKQISDLP